MKILKNKLLLSGIIVLLIIVVPSFIFSIYQYSTVTDEEKIISDVYKNQLETILFSVNQYSIDVVNNWTINLKEIYLTSEDDIINETTEFVNQNDLISQLNIIDYNQISKEGIVISELKDAIKITEIIEKYIENHSEDLSRLEQFLKNDYQQIIGVQLIEKPELSFLVFIFKQNESTFIGILAVNTKRFIKEILSPKIQEVAENRMNLLVYNEESQELIFTTQAESQVNNVQSSKELWLFPGYYLGIELKGNTLNDLVKKRVRTAVLLIIIFNIIVISGILFLFKNVKREVEFAKIKSDFVSNVSHELRTPLAMISMYSETLLLDRIKDDKKKLEYYDIINQETNRLTGIVNNILNFSQIENNKRTYSFTEARLNEIIQEIVRVYKNELLNKGFKYSLNLEDGLSNINIDKNAVKDAVINLISNSIKYSNEIKEIEIKTGENSKNQYLEVIDKGLGISDQAQKLIFDKFYRVTEGNLAYNAQGSGLGLSIVKHIMDAHNGKIEVESKINVGSSFKLIFPISNN